MEGLSPLDTIYLDQFTGVRVAIGDGGNEAGLAPVKDKVKKFIRNGEKIASDSNSDFVIVASVSTWGAYGLTFAVDLEAGLGDDWSVNVGGELRVAEKIAELGFCDGITGAESLGVDGLDWEMTRRVIEDLAGIVNKNV